MASAKCYWSDLEFMELYWHIDAGLNIGNFLHFYFYLLYSKPKYQPNKEFSSSGLYRNVPNKFYLQHSHIIYSSIVIGVACSFQKWYLSKLVGKSFIDVAGFKHLL